jgi:glycosyltransferase involved in cell wall biosynthesis
VAGLPPHLPIRGGTALPGTQPPDGPYPDGAELPDALCSPQAAHLPATQPQVTQPSNRCEPGAAEHQAAEPAAAGRLSSTPDPLHLLFFGIVRPYKGLDVLLRALARAGDGFTLTVAGEFWAGLDATRVLVSELGLEDRVELRPGYVPVREIGGLLRRADALVLPYRSATASQNVWLAFAHGVPVIATRTGTFCEQVSDDVDGLLCEPGDGASLAAALVRFGGPGVAERLRHGVRAVEPGALWEAYLDALLAAASPGTPPA